MIQASRIVQPFHRLKVAEALDLFVAPEGASAKIQIVYPFAVHILNSFATPVSPPIGPAYVAALVEKAGYDVDIIDAPGEAMDQVRYSDCGNFLMHGLSVGEIVGRIDPDTAILGLSAMFSQQWSFHRAIVEEAKKRHPDLIVVLGGEHVSALPEYLLASQPEVDYVVTGEGELAFLELAHKILTGQDTTDIGGVGYRADGGGIAVNHERSRIEDIDNLPMPAWHLTKIESYFTSKWSWGIGESRSIPVLGTRGCPYRCTFCSAPGMWSTRYITREPARVVAEIRYLIDTFEIDSFDFFDLTAIIRKEWILEFCAELKRLDVDISWQLPSGTRSEVLDHETLTAIRDAGCLFIVYAPDSGSKNSLAVIKKQIDLGNIVKSIRAAVDVGHTVKVNLILGYPHETRRDIYRTIWFACRLAFLGIDDCLVNVYIPYPGSAIYGQLRQDGFIPEPGDEYFESMGKLFRILSFRSYCKNVSSIEVGSYKYLAMAVFYALSYMLHPKKIGRLASGLLGRRFSPQNHFEQRILDFVSMKRLLKRSPSDSTL